MAKPIIREKPVKNIIGHSRLTPDGFCANPYTGCSHACKYCFAEYMNRYSEHDEPWGTYVDVKFWYDVGRTDRLWGKKILLSSVTDPYQPAEAQYGRTRALLEQLQGSGCRLSILTKSDLVLRDLDLIRKFPEATVSWSVNTLDENFRIEMDHAASIERRLAAMKTFHDAGIRTVCFVAPVFPGITDIPALLQGVQECCDEVWIDRLNLRGPNRRVILDYIRIERPDLFPLYRSIYIDGELAWWEDFSRDLQQ